MPNSAARRAARRAAASASEPMPTVRLSVPEIMADVLDSIDDLSIRLANTRMRLTHVRREWARAGSYLEDKRAELKFIDSVRRQPGYGFTCNAGSGCTHTDRLRVQSEVQDAERARTLADAAVRAMWAECDDLREQLNAKKEIANDILEQTRRDGELRAMWEKRLQDAALRN